MRTVQLEFAAGHEAPAIAAQREASGVAILPGYEPVPVRRGSAAPTSLVVTVLVPSGVPLDRLRAIPGVLGVSGDVRIGPLK